MYEVKTNVLERDMFLAGNFPVEKKSLEVNEGETIKARELVKLVNGKASKYVKADATAKTKPYGIAASDADDAGIVVYLTGDFFESGLILPDEVEVAEVEPMLRENGIFLKKLLPDV